MKIINSQTIIGNYSFNYYLAGKKTQPLIFFLHGFLGNSSVFQDAITILGDQFQYLAVDLPGHGLTRVFGSEKDYDLINTAQALTQLLEKLQLQKCFLFGYSMGGRLALYMALKFPNLFEQVILESASPGLKTEQEQYQRQQQDQQLANELIEDDFRLFLSRWYNKPLFNSLKQNERFPILFQQRLNNNPVELAKSLQQMGVGSQPSLWCKLSALVQPTLLLVGALDQKFESINQEMNSLCPDSRLKVIGNCGHNIHWENTSVFAEEIKKFLCQ